MDTRKAHVRSVFIGLALAALSAGSLVAFAIVAGSADDPSRSQRVLAARPDLQVDPVVLGTRITQQEATSSNGSDGQERVRPIVISADSIEPAVLGTRFRNKSDDSKPASKPDTKNAPTTPTGGDKNENPEPRSPSCSCEGSSKKNNSPNGHAYGHDKPPGTGLARGHDKSHAAGKSKDKDSK